jgi:deazaflavin-dependent oxidoreductase (nitroreductase family)
MSAQFRKLVAKRTELELSVIGRKSKKELPRPVWFVLKDDLLLLLPVSGRSTQWYKNLLRNPTVKLKAGSKTFVGKANLETRKDAVQDAVKLFTSKYGSADMKKYYETYEVAVEVKLK